jgi:hypothetical protein
MDASRKLTHESGLTAVHLAGLLEVHSGVCKLMDGLRKCVVARGWTAQ